MHHPRRGAELIEMALVLPVFLLVLIGMMEVAWLFYYRSSLDAAANIGCRAGAIIDPGKNESDMDALQVSTQAALVQAMSEQGVADCDTQCSSAVEAVGDSPGRSLVCSVTYDFTPLIGLVLGKMQLESTQVVRMEWQRG